METNPSLEAARPNELRPRAPRAARLDPGLELLPAQRAAFDRFMAHFTAGVDYPVNSFLRGYVSLLLDPLVAKSRERMARRAGISSSYLRKLLDDPRWDDGLLRDRFRARVRRTRSSGRPSAVIFETRWHKSERSPARLGQAPPVPFLIHLGWVHRSAAFTLDSDAYFPESWLADPALRASRSVPDGHPYRPPWQIALDLLGGARRRGLRPGWVLLEPRYASEASLLERLDREGYRYVAEIPASFCGWLSPGLSRPAGKIPTPGEPESADARPGPGRPPQSVKDLCRGLALSGTRVLPAPDPRRPAERWRTGWATFQPGPGEKPHRPVFLVVLKEDSIGETRYVLSNTFPKSGVGRLAELALSRRPLEGRFQGQSNLSALDSVALRDLHTLRRHLVLASISALLKLELTEARERPFPPPAPGPREFTPLPAPEGSR